MSQPPSGSEPYGTPEQRPSGGPQGRGRTPPPPGTNSGNVACTIVQGRAVVSWTDHQALAEGSS